MEAFYGAACDNASSDLTRRLLFYIKEGERKWIYQLYICEQRTTLCSFHKCFPEVIRLFGFGSSVSHH